MFLARIGEKSSTRIDRTWLLAADVMFHWHLFGGAQSDFPPAFRSIF
jgi:hypothetical protein